MSVCYRINFPFVFSGTLMCFVPMWALWCFVPSCTLTSFVPSCTLTKVGPEYWPSQMILIIFRFDTPPRTHEKMWSEDGIQTEKRMLAIRC